MTRAALRWKTWAAFALLLGIALGGCAVAIPILPAGPGGIVLIPRTDPLTYDPDARFFFVEYLKESPGTIRRVAVLLELAEGELGLLLNPERYSSADIGVAALKEMIPRYLPLRLNQIRNGDGKPLGYAFLPPGAGLRLLSRELGRYTFELTGN